MLDIDFTWSARSSLWYPFFNFAFEFSEFDWESTGSEWREKLGGDRGPRVCLYNRSVEKVKKEMERSPDKSLAIFMKVDDPTAPTLSLGMARREKYLAREIGGLALDRITITKLPTKLE